MIEEEPLLLWRWWW